MVCDKHKIACCKIPVQAACCICKEQYLCPHKLHKACRKHNICDRITFVIMYASLHTHNWNTIDITEDITAFMSCYCGHRKALYIVIIQSCNNIYGFTIITQSGTQNKCNFRNKINLFLKTFIAFHKLFIYSVHILISFFCSYTVIPLYITMLLYIINKNRLFFKVFLHIEHIFVNKM